MSAAVKPMQEAAIRQYAKQLHLPTLGGQFARLAEQAVKEQQSPLSYLEALLEVEVEERGRKAMARRIQEARFPAVKTLEEFDFQCASHIPAPLLRNLSEGGYLERREPIIFLGETGTGKTHLATGLAVAACRQRKRVRFTTAEEMVTEQIEAQNHAELTRVRNCWTRYALQESSARRGACSTTRSLWRRLMSRAAFTIGISSPYSPAVAIRAAVSLPKQEPPHPIPAWRKRVPIRASSPMPLATWEMSAPTFSASCPISLM